MRFKLSARNPCPLAFRSWRDTSRLRSGAEATLQRPRLQLLGQGPRATVNSAFTFERARSLPSRGQGQRCSRKCSSPVSPIPGPRPPHASAGTRGPKPNRCVRQPPRRKRATRCTRRLIARTAFDASAGLAVFFHRAPRRGQRRQRRWPRALWQPAPLSADGPAPAEAAPPADPGRCRRPEFPSFWPGPVAGPRSISRRRSRRLWRSIRLFPAPAPGLRRAADLGKVAGGSSGGGSLLRSAYILGREQPNVELSHMPASRLQTRRVPSHRPPCRPIARRHRVRQRREHRGARLRASLRAPS